MEILAVIGAFVLIGAALWKPMQRLNGAIGRRALEREAETDLYREMNRVRAEQVAADKILRKSGERP